MGDQILLPGLKTTTTAFDFEYGVQAKPFIEVAEKPKAVTAVMSLKAVRHLLSDKPLVRPRLLLKRGGQAAHLDQISVWSKEHTLSMFEVGRLKAVFAQFPPETWAEELSDELRCILAARKLAVRKPLTNETIDRARKTFEQGQMGFFGQDVD